MLHTVKALFVGLLLAVAPVQAAPEGQHDDESIIIPFDPPLGESLRYRWEQADKKDGETTLSWSIDSYRFDESEGGYRLTVEPVSSGSNEKDPAMLELAKKLDELTKLPFVLRLNDDAKIVELERGDEYWDKIIAALTDVLATMELKRPGQDKMIEAIIGLYKSMPAETRLAKLTEPIQPLVEFAWTEPTIGEPILTTTETNSPLGLVKQNVAITLTKVSDGFAHVTIRSSISAAELKKLTSAMFDRLNNGALSAEEISKVKSQLAALENFGAETVSDYKISTEDGMLESFLSTQTISVTVDEKRDQRVKTLSVTRVD